MADAHLEVDKIKFSYGDRAILNELSFSCAPAEYITLLGPNGVGKTTLLRCIMGILPLKSGSITLLGRPQSAYDAKSYAKYVGYVPQFFEPFFSYTVFEFIMMGRYPYVTRFRGFTKEDQRIVTDTMELTEVSEFSSRPIKSLSAGERQRVLLAAALVQQPKILLLDEPTAFLDLPHVSKLQQVLSRVKSLERTTIIAATHDLNVGAYYADKVLALLDGKICFDGEPSEFMKEGPLETLYGGKFIRVPHPHKHLEMIVPG